MLAKISRGVMPKRRMPWASLSMVNGYWIPDRLLCELIPTWQASMSADMVILDDLVDAATVRFRERLSKPMPLDTPEEVVRDLERMAHFFMPDQR